ncbi:MAG: long-chain-acyl-CoA synthetase [Mycobacteriaceae bacterium]
MSATTVTSNIGLKELIIKVPKVALDAPILLRGLPGFLRKPEDKVSIGLIFQQQAAKHSGRAFLRFEGSSMSYGEANARVNRYAAALAKHGVKPGDVVGLVGKNAPSTLLFALASTKLGAVTGMLNYNQRGEVLSHSLGLLHSKVLIVGEGGQEAIDSISDEIVADKVLSGEELENLAKSESTENPVVTAQIKAKEKAFYIFTSGTTGLPKASLMSHFRWLKSMSGLGAMGVRLKSSDTLYCCLPLYHNNALTVSLSSVLSSGATLAIGRSFSASKFWDDAIRNDATAAVYIGEICRYLLNQPAKSTDRSHKVRTIVGNGMRPEVWDEFTSRFGITRVAEFYGASECNIAFINALNLRKTAGICPLPFTVVAYDPDTGKAVRGANGKLQKVKTGEVGLLLSKITSRAPFDGYTDDKATESKLLRNGFAKNDCWFDTGDLVRKQGWMHVAFVDRLGDTFRWKGENVATTEVEGALSAFDGIEECTVYGVLVPGTDGKAGMAAIKLKDGIAFDGKALAEHVYNKLPAYSFPLFVRIVDSLEHTSTFKSRKVELRNEGFNQIQYQIADPVYVLQGRSDGYVPSHDQYPEQVQTGQAPQS